MNAKIWRRGRSSRAMPVIGFLHSGTAAASSYQVAPLRQGLNEANEAGFVEGRNVAT